MEMQEDYYYQCSDGLIMFVGHPKINKENFLDLKPGDKISLIGTKPNTKTIGSPTLNRIDEFRPYVTYIGTRFEHKMGETLKELILFKIRDEDKSQQISESDNFYVAYIVMRSEDIIELKTYDPERKVFRFYKPYFTLFDE